MTIHPQLGTPSKKYGCIWKFSPKFLPLKYVDLRASMQVCKGVQGGASGWNGVQKYAGWEFRGIQGGSGRSIWMKVDEKGRKWMKMDESG